HVLRLPLRVTVTSSLATVFLSSLGGAVGKLASASLPLGPAAVLVTASLLGAPLGTRVSARVRARHLQALLAAAVLGTAVQIWYAILT
ncbi:MAG: TSUP family transporter, partial [Clostridia bacterium]|nr:TSUP family transporter [Clostridia bacterium]